MDNVVVERPIFEPYALNDERNTLVRHILYLPKIDEDACTPAKISMTNYYPISYYYGEFACNIKETKNTTNLLGSARVSSNLVNAVKASITPDSINIDTNTQISCDIPIHILFEKLQIGINVPPLEINHTDELLGTEIIIKGSFKFILRFNKCAKSNQSTCYKVSHPKVWSLEMRCISGNILHIERLIEYM